MGPACQDYANGPTIWRGPVRSDPSRENLCGQEASVQSHDMMQKCCSQKLVFSCSRFLCFLFLYAACDVFLIELESVLLSSYWHGYCFASMDTVEQTSAGGACTQIRDGLAG